MGSIDRGVPRKSRIQGERERVSCTSVLYSHHSKGARNGEQFTTSRAARAIHYDSSSEAKQHPVRATETTQAKRTPPGRRVTGQGRRQLGLKPNSVIASATIEPTSHSARSLTLVSADTRPDESMATIMPSSLAPSHVSSDAGERQTAPLDSSRFPPTSRSW